MEKKKITKKTKIGELLEFNPELAEVLMSSGMGCCGCPAAQMETLEEGCQAHGMDDKDIDKLLEKVNKKEAH